MVKKKKAFGTHYLRSLHIDAFGSVFQRNIGPFSEGLNVVYGPNEAGKTTTNAFIGGVLFGWPEARGGRNAYKPAGAQRSGTLVFGPRASQQQENEIICTRSKNSDGIKPDPQPRVLADIDEETYSTIFALTSDELLSLGRGPDITSHLLTAGAGTNVSPVQALEEVQARINACLSRASQYPDSLPNLANRLQEVEERLHAAENEAAHFKQQSREYAELKPRMAEASEELTRIHAEVDLLVGQCSALERLQEEELLLEEEHEELLAREAELAQLGQRGASVLGTTGVSGLSEAQIRSAQEDLQDLSVKQTSLELEYSTAQDTYQEAKAQFAALAESGLQARQQHAQQRRAKVLSALCFLLPTLFALLALYLFNISRNAHTPAYLIMAIVATLAALLFAGLGPFLLSRQANFVSPDQLRIDDATQDLNLAEQRLELSQEKLESLASQIARKLDEYGLGQAKGSIRLARSLLEDMRSEQNAAQLQEQQAASLAVQRSTLDAKRQRNAQAYRQIYTALGETQDTPLVLLQQRIEEKTQARNTLQNETNDLSARVAQLEVELDRAQHLQEFDQLKLEHAQLLTRIDETKTDLAQLLLVRRLLEESIARWEDKSQPEVYREASRFLAILTNGSWQEVRTSEDDQLVVSDAFGQVLDPSYLSLGTLQQLYLALRIALLVTAENVGRSVPILADDILVNFDAERRKGAAHALEELAKLRQVVVFTCHEEVVRLMQDTCRDVNVVEL